MTGCKTVYPGSIPGVASSLRNCSAAKLPRRGFLQAEAGSHACYGSACQPQVTPLGEMTVSPAEI